MINPKSWKGYWLVWLIAFCIFIILVPLFHWIDSKFPDNHIYDNVQEYREKNNYDDIDADDYLLNYDGDYETFTEQDVINAYNQGIEDGINQTIEYYESE